MELSDAAAILRGYAASDGRSGEISVTISGISVTVHVIDRLGLSTGDDHVSIDRLVVPAGENKTCTYLVHCHRNYRRDQHLRLCRRESTLRKWTGPIKCTVTVIRNLHRNLKLLAGKVFLW